MSSMFKDCDSESYPLWQFDSTKGLNPEQKELKQCFETSADYLHWCREMIPGKPTFSGQTIRAVTALRDECEKRSSRARAYNFIEYNLTILAAQIRDLKLSPEVLSNIIQSVLKESKAIVNK